MAWYPASIRWPHIDEPMTPVPIQPIRVFPGAMSSAMSATPKAMAGSLCMSLRILAPGVLDSVPVLSEVASGQ